MSETVIVGGGLAGGAAAALLARAGQPVRLLERTTEPKHKICGEFLSIEAQRHLQALGVDPLGFGASPIDRVRIADGERRIEARLPFTALGLTRRRLDEALLHRAESLGARIDRGVVVRSWDGGALKTSAGDLAPSALLLATGKHDLRGAQRARAASDAYIGFKMYFRLPEPVRASLEGAIEVVLLPEGYAGLQLVEGGVANLCLVASSRSFAAAGKTWDGLFASLLEQPHLRERLADAEPLLPQPLTIAGIPYGFLHRPRADDDPRLYRLGDQAAVIPSFTGDGMAIALHSGRLAASAVRDGLDSAAFQTRLRRAVERPVALATALQRIGETRLGRRVIMGGMQRAPGVLGVLAQLTRIPSAALTDSGLPG